MTLSRQNAVLSQVINVGDNAIGDTILIPSGNVVNLSGILTAISGNFSSLTVNNNPVYHSGILPNPVTGTGAANHIPYWSSTSGLLADSNQLIWDANNNRLGIGTSTPSGQLHVIGTGLFTDSIGIGTGIQATTPPEKLVVDGNIRLADTATSIGNRLQLFRGGGSAYDYTLSKEGFHIALSTSNDSSTQRGVQIGVHIGTTWTPRIHMNGWTGQIGVGTVSIQSGIMLDVRGSGIFSSGIRVGNSSTNGFIYGPSGNANIQFNNAESNRIDITCTEFFVASITNLNGASTRVNGTLVFPRTGSAPTSTATQTNPNELRFFNGLWNGSSAYDGFNTIHSIASTSVSGASRLAFLINNGDGTQNRTERLSITSTSGNIGINNTNPQYTLDVNGNANISGVFSISGVPLAEIIDDEVAGLLVASSGLNLNYDDSINTLTISTNRNITNSSRLFLWTNFR